MSSSPTPHRIKHVYTQQYETETVAKYAYLWGVAAYAVADGDVVIFEVVTVGSYLAQVPRRRRGPNLATTVVL